METNDTIINENNETVSEDVNCKNIWLNNNNIESNEKQFLLNNSEQIISSFKNESLSNNDDSIQMLNLCSTFDVNCTIYSEKKFKNNLKSELLSYKNNLSETDIIFTLERNNLNLNKSDPQDLFNYSDSFITILKEENQPSSLTFNYSSNLDINCFLKKITKINRKLPYFTPIVKNWYENF